MYILNKLLFTNINTRFYLWKRINMSVIIGDILIITCTHSEEDYIMELKEKNTNIFTTFTINNITMWFDSIMHKKSTSTFKKWWQFELLTWVKQSNSELAIYGQDWWIKL